MCLWSLKIIKKVVNDRTNNNIINETCEINVKVIDIK